MTVVRKVIETVPRDILTGSFRILDRFEFRFGSSISEISSWIVGSLRFQYQLGKANKFLLLQNQILLLHHIILFSNKYFFFNCLCENI